MQLATGLFRPVVYEVILHMKSMFNDARLQNIYSFLRGLQQFVNFKKQSISCMLLNLSIPIILISVGPVVMLSHIEPGNVSPFLLCVVS